MVKAQMQTLDLGGAEVQLTKSQMAQALKIIKALNEKKAILEKIVVLEQRQAIITKAQEANEGKLSRHYKDQQSALTPIMTYYTALAEAVKDQKEYEKSIAAENKKSDERKKKSAWQLFYFATAAVVLGMMVNNSKVASHFFDILGASLGFVLDMMLLNAIPWILEVVNALFGLGEWIAGLPEPIKDVIAFLTLLIGVGILIGIGKLMLGFLGIGAAAEGAAGTAAAGTGIAGLIAKLTALTSAPWILTLTGVGAGILGGLSIGFIQDLLRGGMKSMYMAMGMPEPLAALQAGLTTPGAGGQGIGTGGLQWAEKNMGTPPAITVNVSTQIGTRQITPEIISIWDSMGITKNMTQNSTPS